MYTRHIPANAPIPLADQQRHMYDFRWHRQQWHERSKAAQLEKRRARMMARAKIMEQYQEQKFVEVDDGCARLSMLEIRPGHLTLAVRDSPVYRLPASVREKIFGYAVAERDLVDVKKHTLTTPGHQDGNLRRESWRCLPSLLRVSQQVQAEAAVLFHRENAFVGTVYGVDATEIITWIADTLVHLLSEVKHFTISLSLTDFGGFLDIIDAKRDAGGLTGKAMWLAKVIKYGLPNAIVAIEGPTIQDLEMLHKDAKRVGIAEALADAISEEWKRELEWALSAG